MTDNPLKVAVAEKGGGVNLRPGESYTFFPKEGVPWTLTRTDRDYAYDLADAYNARMAPGAAMRWAVSDRGELYARSLGR